MHVSIGGGLIRALDRAAALKINALQIFSASPRSWRARPLEPKPAEEFRGQRLARGFFPLVIHSSYLLNIATPDAELYRKSIAGLKAEMARASALGAEFVVLHPGSAGEGDKSDGLIRAAAALTEALAEASGGTRLLLENTAGAGRHLGGTFTELSRIQALVKAKTPVGICCDTCHAFAAGYDLRSAASVEALWRRLQDECDLKTLALIHLNDSLTPLGSGVDRHQHIGKGYIRREGFRALLRHPGLAGLPLILETPKGDNLKDDAPDRRNLAAVRRLLA